MTEPTRTLPTRHRRWFQFSLRSLLLMMLVFSCGLGWLMTKRRQAQQAWKRIEEANQRGVKLFTADDLKKRGYIPPQGTWLEEWLGISSPAHLKYAEVMLDGDPKEIIPLLDNFPEITDVRIRAINLADNHLATLAGMTRLRDLHIADSPLHGTGLIHLADMNSLVGLYFVSCENLTDDAFPSIPNLPYLIKLSIEDCPINGTNLSHLATACPQLKSLRLQNTQLNEHGMLELGKVDHLESLFIIQTPITGNGMAHLSRLQDLEMLSLAQTTIGDQGLLHLSSERLTSLNLSSTLITDSSLSLFARLPSLKSLQLYKTKVTDASMPALAQLPQIESIDLRETEITDAALHHFSYHKTLQQLDLPKRLSGTAGVTALQKANPKLVLQFL